MQKKRKKVLTLDEKLRGTLKESYTVERTGKAEIILDEKSEKAESCRENSWNKIQLKGP